MKETLDLQSVVEKTKQVPEGSSFAHNLSASMIEANASHDESLG